MQTAAPSLLVLGPAFFLQSGTVTCLPRACLTICKAGLLSAPPGHLEASVNMEVLEVLPAVVGQCPLHTLTPLQ